MKKRNIFILVIFLGTLTQFILGNFVFKNFSGIVSFVLLVPFYLIVYIYYQRYRFIKWICFFTIFTLMANVFMLDYLSIFPMYSAKIKLIGMVSFFGSIINNVLVFVFILQPNPKGKLLKSLFAFVVLINYFFFSYYIFPLTGILIAFFGPAEQAIESTVVVVEIIGYILVIAVMIAQMIIIKLLDTEEEYYLKAKIR